MACKKYAGIASLNPTQVLWGSNQEILVEKATNLHGSFQEMTQCSYLSASDRYHDTGDDHYQSSLV